MKIWILVVALLGPLTSEASFETTPELVGSWELHQLIYQGEVRPPLNPDLRIQFTFDENGQSRLFWYRVNESGFCERRGEYRWEQEGGFLVDKVTWVNPDNQAECSRDPDMRLGNVTRTPITFEDGNLHFHLGLSGEEFIYIFERSQADSDL